MADAVTLPEQEPSMSELHVFLDKVICDGRYITAFQEKPDDVARWLGTKVSTSTVMEITTTSAAVLLSGLYFAKFASQPLMRANVAPALAVGIVIVVGAIVIIIGVVIAVVLRGRGEMDGVVTDRSANKDSKV